MKNVSQKPIKGKDPDNNFPVLVSLDDAGQMLGIDARTVRRLSQSGKLPPILKLGHSARLSRQGIIDCITRLNFRSGVLQS